MYIKSFITFGPGVNLTNIVPLSQTKRLVKLERLYLTISSDIEHLQVRPGASCTGKCYKVFHSDKIWLYLQMLDQALMACQGQTLQLIREHC
jgi:hypothetical protein